MSQIFNRVSRLCNTLEALTQQAPAAQRCSLLLELSALLRSNVRQTSTETHTTVTDASSRMLIDADRSDTNSSTSKPSRSAIGAVAALGFGWKSAAKWPAAFHSAQSCLVNNQQSTLSTNRGSSRLWGLAPSRCLSTTALLACSSSSTDASASSLNAAPTDLVIQQIQGTQDLQQLHQLVQQLVQQAPPATQLAAVYKQAVQLQTVQGDKAVHGDRAVHGDKAVQGDRAVQHQMLDEISACWKAALPSANIQDISCALKAWMNLNYWNEQCWHLTLQAVPELCAQADGQDLSDIAIAIGKAAQSMKALPGFDVTEAEDGLRAVTQQLITMVQAAQVAAATGSADPNDGRSVSIQHISTVRWAHEMLEAAVADH